RDRARGAGRPASFGEVRGGPGGSSGLCASTERSASARVTPTTVLQMQRLALLGGGRMGEALLGGLLDAGFDADSITVAEVESERRHDLEERFKGVRVVPSPAWAVADDDVVVVEVKAYA